MPAIPVEKYVSLFVAYLVVGETCAFACRATQRAGRQRHGDEPFGEAGTDRLLATRLPEGRIMVGFTDRRVIFLDDEREDRGSMISDVALRDVTNVAASKAKIYQEGQLSFVFSDGSTGSLTLPGPDSRELVRFLRDHPVVTSL